MFRECDTPVYSRPRRFAPIIIVWVLAAAATACNSKGSDDQSAGTGDTGGGSNTVTTTDTTPPTVATVTPAGAGAGIEPGTTVSFSLSEPIDPTSIDTTRFTLTGPYGAIAASLAVTASGATLTPQQPLPTNATITATVAASVRDLAGNALGSPYTWTFVTRGFTRVLGTSAGDEAHGVALDSSGDIYVAGYTDGSLDGQLSAGLSDIALVKYDAAGNRVWSRQLGDVNTDRATAVAVDSTDGILVAGYTETALGGNSNAGMTDVVLVKYNSSGTQQWVRQLGTTSWDEATAVITDAGNNIVVVGYTDGDLAGTGNAGGTDAFVAKYGADGTLLWARQHGTTASDAAVAVAADSSGNIYITGFSRGNLDGNTNAGPGGRDLFLIKYNASGVHQWTRLFGTLASDNGAGITVDGSGDIFVIGTTAGDLDGIPNAGAGTADFFIIKYDSAGNRVWTRQHGSSADELAYGVATDNTGALYVTGATNGGLDGNTGSGANDLFVVKYDGAGNRQWTRQLGTAGADVARAIAVDRAASVVYVAGATDAALDGQTNAGGNDLFAVKYDSNGDKR